MGVVDQRMAESECQIGSLQDELHSCITYHEKGPYRIVEEYGGSCDEHGQAYKSVELC